MNLFLEVLSGPLSGKKYKARLGLTVGRRNGDVLLEDDSKVSGLHAKIEIDNKSQLVLVDQGSANGFVLNGRRVRKVAMMPGVNFRIGETAFRVVELTPEEVSSLFETKTWREPLRELLERDPGLDRPIAGAAQTFTPVLQLEFIRGFQTDTVYTLTYGPRVAGFGHLDLDLKEMEAGEIAFEIHPGPGTAFFRDKSQGKLKINKQEPQDGQSLQEGDQISLGATVIRVRYL
ncbi:MAG: FHA domain-containing protein [Bdellovibrionaceae bacterium]|nr:FHA domain-containing protein [Pseudobdellovibrionaceae bacterium]MBX3033680.1 FHA domain-containing protein [Pseudobdellovibrionaceae bacterium]